MISEMEMFNAGKKAMRKKIPRIPTKEEKRKITEFYIDETYGNEVSEEEKEMMEDNVEGAYISVFENYQTGSPGYCGKVIFIVFDGSPFFHDVLTEKSSKRDVVNELRRTTREMNEYK